MLSVQTKHQFNYLVMPLGGAERTGYTRLTYCCMVWHYLKSAALFYMRESLYITFLLFLFHGHNTTNNLVCHSWAFLKKLSIFQGDSWSINSFGICDMIRCSNLFLLGKNMVNTFILRKKKKTFSMYFYLQNIRKKAFRL